MGRYLKESKCELADKIYDIASRNGFWTRQDEFEESMEDENLSVDYMDSESADISDNETEEYCRVVFNRGGRSFAIAKILCFDDRGNSYVYDPDSYDEDDEYEENFRRAGSYKKLRIAEAFDVADDLQDIWDFVQEQEYDSAATSLNQLPGGVKAVASILEPGTINLDYDGGRYDKAVEYLKQVDVMNLVFDPFNRSQEHNKEVLDIIKEAGGADSCTCCNVLNVIDGDAAKVTALKNIKRLVKSGGKVYIQTYEGSDKVETQNDKGKTVKRPSGVGKTTSKGWQENKETKAYIPIVQKVFSDATYKNIKGVPMIVCTA